MSIWSYVKSVFKKEMTEEERSQDREVELCAERCFGKNWKRMPSVWSRESIVLNLGIYSDKNREKETSSLVKYSNNLN